MITATAHRFRGRAGRRIALAVAAAAALGMGVTACGQGDTGAGKVNSSAASQDGEQSTGGSASGGSGGQAGGKGSARSAGSGEHTTTGGGGSTTGGDSGGSTGGGAAQGGERTIVGKLSYLAPGKLIVKPDSGGTDQAFLVANATRVLGAAAICGDPEGNVSIDKEGFGTYKCDVEQLETAAKTNSVTVRVTMDTKVGAADVVAEKYHP
ncbi:hypothetical protein [Streptomyces benahoarensis]|uniref:Lipoprotein n=1 Tax=Streptomyces benahoarensis TaxID=2595054 RepID=A0A553Z759_9ACTN|nr:hypothetical protein [Streptomyces benahoarensis]TSB19389.1 hypothetical protein FNJ62_22555 [Streptomyces benahoarensis]TSB37264.1 hypothetical protein FNZ23_18745 [Streptomyces benahoarensis]